MVAHLLMGSLVAIRSLLLASKTRFEVEAAPHDLWRCIVAPACPQQFALGSGKPGVSSGFSPGLEGLSSKMLHCHCFDNARPTELDSC